MKTCITRIVNYTECVNIGIDDIAVTGPSIMSVDGSTKNTGVCILRIEDATPMYSIAFKRDSEEDKVQYKVALKKELYRILLRNKNIGIVYYEEPFIGYAVSSEALMMLRTSIEEVIVENSPTIDYVHHYEINNKRWKKGFLYPMICPNGTENEKRAIKEKAIKMCKCYENLSQDEMDAYGIGREAVRSIKETGTENGLSSLKKVKAFKYNIKFIGADDDDGFNNDFNSAYNGPECLLESGAVISDLGRNTKFDKAVYDVIGDEDRIGVLKFKSSTHGNIVLQYKIGALASNFEYIYAIVWRKTRRKK